MKNMNLQEKVLWSRSITWNSENDALNIEGFRYPKIFNVLFPKFYFITQKPIELKNIIEEFNDFDDCILKDFVLDLMKKSILVSKIPTIHQLAYSINNSFANKHSESIKYNAHDLEEYKDNVLKRYEGNCDTEKIELKTLHEKKEYIFNRRSCRDFIEDKKILFDDFSKLISTFRQINTNPVYYCYPTAGGLYPIDIYLCVKNERVEGLKEGIYYYNPKHNSLSKISNQIVDKNFHFYTNQNIYESSAFSIMLVYNAECNMPKYSGMGYMYGLIDTGVIVGYTSVIAEQLNLGLCSIGDCRFEEVDKLLNLKKNQICVHCMEIGLRKEGI